MSLIGHAMLYQYLLIGLALIATVIATLSDTFGRFKAHSLVASVVVAVLSAGLSTILLNKDFIVERQTQCLKVLEPVHDFLDIKQRVRTGTSLDMLRADPEELEASARFDRAQRNGNRNGDLEANLHYSLGVDILVDAMGNADTSFERSTKIISKLSEQIKALNCELVWKNPPEGTHSCSCWLVSKTFF